MSRNLYAEVLPLMRKALTLLDAADAGTSMVAVRLAQPIDVAEREQQNLPDRGNDNDQPWDGMPIS